MVHTTEIGSLTRISALMRIDALTIVGALMRIGAVSCIMICWRVPIPKLGHMAKWRFLKVAIRLLSSFLYDLPKKGSDPRGSVANLQPL
jgi:hypothetical protein